MSCSCLHMWSDLLLPETEKETGKPCMEVSAQQLPCLQQKLSNKYNFSFHTVFWQTSLVTLIDPLNTKILTCNLPLKYYFHVMFRIDSCITPLLKHLTIYIARIGSVNKPLALLICHKSYGLVCKKPTLWALHTRTDMQVLFLTIISQKKVKLPTLLHQHWAYYLLRWSWASS